MAFVAYLISLVAAFVGVLALYGTLLKPMMGKPLPAQTVAADKAEPETTSSTRVRPAPPAKRNEATEARAQEEAADTGREPSQARRATSRRSPVRSEPGEGLRLAPERCWIVTDSTRGYGYYGRCQ
jgi:hypothetical protein